MSSPAARARAGVLWTGLPCLPGDRSHSAEGSAGDRPEAGSCTGEEREGEPLPQCGDCLWPLLHGPLESGPPLWGSGMRPPSVILRNAL